VLFKTAFGDQMFFSTAHSIKLPWVPLFNLKNEVLAECGYDSKPGEYFQRQGQFSGSIRIPIVLLGPTFTVAKIVGLIINAIRRHMGALAIHSVFRLELNPPPDSRAGSLPRRPRRSGARARPDASACGSAHLESATPPRGVAQAPE